jgi:hypothetical protein
MGAFAPQAIVDVFGLIHPKIPSAVFSGVVGDVNHSFGYHLARADLPGDDYSVQLPLDRKGNVGAASALDISLPPDLMITVTKRLIAAAKKKDPRLKAVREFCGTTNGVNPHPFDLASGTDDPTNTQGWDDSHLSHVHISIYRAFAEDAEALAPIADVITARKSNTDSSGEDDDMKIVRNKDKQAVPLLLGAGTKPQLLGDGNKQRALENAGVTVVAVSDADYQVLRAWTRAK